jgi:hypothetical protein
VPSAGITLRVLLTCEKVLIDQSGTFSLISVFQRINLPAIPEPLVDGAAIPMTWAIFTAWDRDETEGELSFTQTTEVFLPSGKIYATQEINFLLPEGQAQARTIVNLAGFPIYEEGDVSIRVAINGYPGLSHQCQVSVHYSS